MPASRSSSRAVRALGLALPVLGGLAFFAGPKAAWTRPQSNVQALPQAYNVTVVGPLADFRPYVLNDAGQVAGVGLGQNPGSLVRYDPNTGVTAFGQPFGETIVEVRDINGVGEICGETEHRAFMLRSDGTFPALQDDQGLSLRQAFALNDNGTVVVSKGPNFFGIGGTWSNGVFKELPDFAAEQDSPSARGINASGAVCGAVSVLTDAIRQHAALWGSAQSTPGDISPDDVNQHAQFADAINASGQVLGWSTVVINSETRFQAWIRQPGGGARTNIGIAEIQGALGTTGVITGWRLNDSGQVFIWLSDDATNRHGFYIWQNGQAVKLDTLLPTESGFTLGVPLDMNNHGQILAQASGLFGHQAVILTPKTPEAVKPVISNVAPAVGATLFNPVQIRADIADASSVGWVAFIDKGDFNAIDVRGFTKGPGAINFERTLTGGSHTLDIEVRDSSGNISTLTRTFSVDTQPALKSFAFEPSTAKGGATVLAKLELTSPAPKGGLTVTFKSSKKKALKPPKPFLIPAGAITPSFQYKTKKVKKDSTFTITANLGDVSKEAPLNLTRR